MQTLFTFSDSFRKKALTFELNPHLVFFILTLISTFGINRYQYGTFDHAISIPFLKSIVNGGLYPADYLLAERNYLYTFFWNFLGYFIRITGLEVSMVCFVCYLISIYFTFYAFYKLAVVIFEDHTTALFSCFILIFGIPTLGHTNTLESLFLTRTAIMPILLFAIYYFIKEKYYHSYLLQAVGFLFHPLTAIYVCAILFAGAIVTLKNIGMSRFIKCMLILGILSSPIFIMKFLHPAPSLKTIQVEQYWIDLLRLRSAHHVFPFVWPIEDFIKVAVFLTGFVLTWKYMPEKRKHRVIVAGIGMVLILSMIGTAFTEFYPVSIVIQFQFFRSFTLVLYFGFIYYANYLLKEQNLARKILVSILLCAVFFVNIWKFIAFALFIAFFMLIIDQAKKRNQVQQMFAVILLIMVCFGYVAYELRGKFDFRNSQPEEWYDVQKWARLNTSVKDAFIVPPYLFGFRVEAERTIYGDWKDGTQMFFNPIFGKEWIRRMEKLGDASGKNIKTGYENLTESTIVSISKEMPQNNAVYMVVEKPGTKTLKFKEVYNNKSFAVYKVR